MQKADIYQPIESTRPGPAPLIIRAVVTQPSAMVVGGVPSSSSKIESYVLLSAMPDELRQRIELAVQALITAR